MHRNHSGQLEESEAQVGTFEKLGYKLVRVEGIRGLSNCNAAQQHLESGKHFLTRDTQSQ